jgi:glycosyltransferase involved in cell wall biosynthesis
MSKENEPLITTIIPTYKRPQLLKRAIQSVLDQTFPHFQVCVYDNVSCDETRDLVLQMAEKDSRIKYHCHAKHLHAIENFQYGMDQVETPFFSILADDDLLLPDFYQTAIEMMNHHPSAQFFLGSAIDMHVSGNVISANALKWADREYFEPPQGIYELIPNYINWTSALFRREVLRSTRLDPSLTAIDFDFVCRLGAQYPFAFSKKPCAIFIHHAGSYSSYCGSKLVWPGWKKTTESLMALSSLPQDDKERISQLMRNNLEDMLFRLGIKATLQSKYSEAEKTLSIYNQEYPDKKSRAWLVQMLLIRCQNNRWILKSAQKMFTLLLRLKRKPLQKRYGGLYARSSQKQSFIS